MLAPVCTGRCVPITVRLEVWGRSPGVLWALRRNGTVNDHGDYTRSGRHRHHNAQIAQIAPPGRGRDSEGDVTQALRGLLATLAPRPARVEEEVVLSIELNGVHYSLAHRRARPAHEPVKLSAREQEIARLISSGHTNKTVAAVLDISLWTVDTHIRRIFAKLGVRSRSAMVAQLAELGVIGASE